MEIQTCICQTPLYCHLGFLIYIRRDVLLVKITSIMTFNITNKTVCVQFLLTPVFCPGNAIYHLCQVSETPVLCPVPNPQVFAHVLKSTNCAQVSANPRFVHNSIQGSFAQFMRPRALIQVFYSVYAYLRPMHRYCNPSFCNPRIVLSF